MITAAQLRKAAYALRHVEDSDPEVIRFLFDLATKKKKETDMSRILETITTRFTRVLANDAPGAGGANHAYLVLRDSDGEILAEVKFAEGPFTASEPAPARGVFNEDLLAMVLDRLQAFNLGPFKCRENAIAITKIEEAMLWLKKRTDDRARRNVLGTNAV